MAQQILRTNEVMKDICAVFDLPHTRVQRIVLEFVAGEPVVVGVEMKPAKEDGAPLAAVVATVVDRHYLMRTGDTSYKPVDETAELVAEASGE